MSNCILQLIDSFFPSSGSVCCCALAIGGSGSVKLDYTGWALACTRSCSVDERHLKGAECREPDVTTAADAKAPRSSGEDAPLKLFPLHRNL
jgi:hypothetical protein